MTCTDFSCGGFITSPPITLLSFKARKVTLNYAQFENQDFDF